ncbi:hypothetical protein TBLA_0C03710 [Henningerozyma blattae CBS 6284]|uniref:Histone deacetylase complex subunit SAP30 Sin3 binding domain-containing protein n=1 Tax=Henningerozyma blattae (strain ATCC 34711 / CBS 6284 / DSM 70876 / NBRC 10599 / NRRL Y-10934 / UCD 77-7) TaxID=1071380 RepID=I2H1C2_HENB6|nr:hypothetical protein TBLA_0C03710 [Tetrapisispora blattae CBS 6284]CCH60174.1 hypothetical protein TBLA_0C03710 [Tetrapisispora blattae CBS 6284]
MARHTNSNSESETSRSRNTHGGNNSNGGNNNNDNSGTSGKDTNHSTGHGGKHRLNAAQQNYLRELVKTHVTNNHPSLIPIPHPADLSLYSDDFLRRYRDRYNLDCNDNFTLQGYLLGSDIGNQTQSFSNISMNAKADANGKTTEKLLKQSKKSKEKVQGGISKPTTKRVMRDELVAKVADHFNTNQPREVNVVPQFIYKVRNRNRRFRMEFRD